MAHRGAKGRRGTVRGPAATEPVPATEERPKWLWCRRPNEDSRVLKEHRGLSQNGTARLDEVIQRVLAGQARRHDVRHLDGPIWEVRAREGNNHYRALYFRWGSHYVCVMSRYKNQQATPQGWIDVAKARRGQFLEDFGEG